MMSEPDFRDISPALEVRRSAKATRLALRLDPGRRVVTLVVPERTSLPRAYSFAQGYQSWISRKLAALPEVVALEPGARIPFLGREREIVRTPVRGVSAYVSEDEIVLPMVGGDFAARLRRFLKAETLRALEDLARDKAARIGRRVSAVQVRDTASRWGSCSNEGNLSFSWRLCFAPWAAFDYVVAHEVAHLCHMDHSPAFWAQCAELSEDFAAGKGWMKLKGAGLLRYGG